MYAGAHITCVQCAGGQQREGTRSSWSWRDRGFELPDVGSLDELEEISSALPSRMLDVALGCSFLEITKQDPAVCVDVA